ncbi:IS630 family transposase [Streptomyces sp. NPDC051014]|uniref:IS630 family transposase n=1 Tax=Streptomyces sp. NPDC051014 TaxID=3155751 RepID=UPI0033DBB78F
MRVGVRSVQRWRRAWSQNGARALASKGPASLPLLSDELFAVLERELLKGPVAHGWPDQTWTLSRIKTLIGCRFHKGYTVQGVAALLRRHGWSCQVPARRAHRARRGGRGRLDEGDLAPGGRTVAALDAWLVFEDEAGFSMTPPTTRTWSRRGRTPVVRVRGRPRRRLSVAVLACYKTGEPSRLICRPCPDARPDKRKSFSWKDYRDLIQTAHQQLGGPIVLVWDNLNTHLTAGMRRYIAERDWLTVFQLPPYATDLNPVESIWSVLRRTTTANRAFADPDDLITAVRRGLRQLQYRPDVLAGCLTGTGLRRQPP